MAAGTLKNQTRFLRVDFLVVLSSIYARAELPCEKRLDGDHMVERLLPVDDCLSSQKNVP